MNSRYPFNEIEAKWRRKWRDSKAHSPDMDNPGKKLYSLTMFSYPSGDKLHIGHWYNYGPADTWTRFKKMQGYNTFHPQGFDAFGLPAENYALQNGVHPAESTAANIATMRRQLDRIGAMYDWSNYVDTSAPEYYKWTQWIFLKLFELGLAVQEVAPVNWCPSCETVLANEQVKEGQCERCGTIVIQKELKQWFFKITNYTDELLKALDELDWPEKTKTMQRHWIGRSEGAHIHFKLAGIEEQEIVVFTTRPDTLFGATYMVLAPEHPLVAVLTTDDQREAVEAYQAKALAQTELDRISQGREKTGIDTGAKAINPMTGGEIPVWIADYVLATYGTGAIMAVPGSDERDFEFARKYGLEIIEVVSPDGKPQGIDQCYAGQGIAVNSGEFNGLPTPQVIDGISTRLEQMGQGRRTIQFRLRDWCVSRQRYWGAPIPIIHCPNCGQAPVPEADLPVKLPLDIDLAMARGKEFSPLATVEDFVRVKCPKCGADAQRDTDTMDTFVDSAWYFLRYADAAYTDGPFNPDRLKAWLPVDMYIGGSEHATMHLIYARFLTKALRDAGLLNFDEPFLSLRHQGMITAADGARMSKSKGNVVSPDSLVERYGSDVFRSYLMFMGPYDEGGNWSDSGITGLARFQERVWRLLQQPAADEPPAGIVLRKLHVTIRDVTADLEKMRFNTGLSKLMELLNAITGLPAVDKTTKDIFIQLLAPFMPHLAEELWQLADHDISIFSSAWPRYDPQFCHEDVVTLGITINGKRRGEVSLPANADAKTVISAAKEVPAVQSHLHGAEVVTEIVVPGRVVNFVVK